MRELTRTKSRIIHIAALFVITSLLCSCSYNPYCEPFSAEGLENYSKEAVFGSYELSEDLNSDLSVFPDELITDKVEYSANLVPNMFDTDGKIVLECKYDDEQFTDEVKRIRALSKTIKEGKEQYTNKVVYDEDSYSYPAYITIDGFGDSYEYALIDKPENRIVYMYLSYPNQKTLKKYRDYVKKDLSAYEEEEKFDRFSMYYHSFDGVNHILNSTTNREKQGRENPCGCW